MQQRRVPRAEVVERQPHAHAVQRGQGAACGLPVVHEGGLGDLETQGGGIHARVSERPPDDLDQVGLGELAGREVDGEPEPAPARHPQAAHLAARLGEHPLAQRDHEAGLLGDADELAGRDEPPARVLPAHERLDAHDVSPAQPDLRVVQDAELAPPERGAERALDVESLDDALACVLVEQLVASPAALFGSVQGGVGVA